VGYGKNVEFCTLAESAASALSQHMLSLFILQAYMVKIRRNGSKPIGDRADSVHQVRRRYQNSMLRNEKSTKLKLKQPQSQRDVFMTKAKLLSDNGMKSTR